MKRLLLTAQRLALLLLVLCPCLALGQGSTTSQRVVIQNSLGRPLGGISVNVCTTLSQANPTCIGNASLFSDSGLTVPLAQPLTTDQLGQVPTFFALPGFYCYTVSGSYVTDTSCKLIVLYSAAGGTPLVTNPAAPQTITGGFPLNLVGNFNATSIAQCRQADQFSGADIFAKANAAATNAGSPGCVLIPAGTYNTVTTQLTGLDNVRFLATGVTVNWTGTTGCAMKFNGIYHSGISGIKMLGTGTAATKGLCVGSTTGGPGIQTLYNDFDNIQIGIPGIANSGFGVGVFLDGTNLINGTYSNTFFNVISDQNAAQGFLLKPTTANFANANNFVACDAEGNGGDGWQIDGSNGNWYTGARSETNGGYGFNFAGTRLTYGSVFMGGWSESDTLGDTNWGSGANVVQTQILGMQVNSAPPGNVIGDPSGAGNIIQFTFSAARFIDWYAGVFNYHANVHSGTGLQFGLVNDEAPSSGVTTICGLNRTGSNSGSFVCGSPEYVFTVRSDIAFDVAGHNVGSNALPAQSIAIGGAANQTSKITSAATANRAVSLPDAAGSIILNGAGNNSAQAQRIAGCLVGSGAAGATCTTTVTWPSAFADTNYTAVCNGQGITSGIPLNGGYTAKLAASLQFITVNGTAVASQYTAIECWAKHD